MHVVNETDQTVVVRFLYQTGKPIPLDDGIADSLSPGDGKEFFVPLGALTEPGADCANADVVAKAEGEVVDRLEGPVCRGQTWTIEGS